MCFSVDGSTIVTKQSKQITKVGGLGNATYNINKSSAGQYSLLSTPKSFHAHQETAKIELKNLENMLLDKNLWPPVIIYF